MTKVPGAVASVGGVSVMAVLQDAGVGGGARLVLGVGHASQVDAAYALVDAGDDRRFAESQPGSAVLGQFDRPAGQGHTRGSPAADPTVVGDDGGTDRLGEGFGAGPQPVGVDMESVVDRVGGVDDRRFEGG